ncbi:hypothetical protein [Marinobacter sp.]|uniref:hypothetical protein n=1 Tax=Marinobacter sp. TaxID=50741 RepID=UPI0035C6944E
MPNNQAHDPRVATAGERVAQPVGLSVAAVASGAAGVTGTWLEGQTLTISSDGVNGFGSGAYREELFDDFAGKTPGATQQTTDKTGGLGSYKDGGGLFSDAYSHSKGVSLKQFDDATSFFNITRLVLSQSTQVFCTSYWVFVPTGKALPGMSVDSYTPGGSNWKLSWAFAAEPDTAGSPDICLPSNNGTDALTLDGNESSMADFGNHANLSTVHTYGEWMWVYVLVDGVNGEFRVKYLSQSKGLFQYSKSFADLWGTTSPQYFAEWQYPGFVQNAANCEMYYDDVSVHAGPAAGGLVLIGNASTLAACTELSIQRISSRSDSSIAISAQLGPFASFAGTYLFVLDQLGSPVAYEGAEGRLIA